MAVSKPRPPAFELGDFHTTVQARRWDLELTQAEVETRARLWPGFMTYLETGRMVNLPKAAEFRRLCAALEFSTAEALELAAFLDLDRRSLDWLEERRRPRAVAA